MSRRPRKTRASVQLVLARGALAASMLLGALGCSADVAPAPEPTLETRGAFVAIAENDSTYRLLRTLAVIGDGGPDDVFFVVPYLGAPKNFDQARELARDPSLPALETIAVGRRYILSRDWRVVWFRSVSVEEEAGFR
jgi:hypothetical protein